MTKINPLLEVMNNIDDNIVTNAPKSRKRSKAPIIVGIAATFLLTGFAVSETFLRGSNLKYRDANSLNGNPAVVFTSIDAGNSPKTIEKAYTLGKIPEELIYRSSCYVEKDQTLSTLYVPELGDKFSSDSIINLCQFTKDKFSTLFTDVNCMSFKETAVNGKTACFFSYEKRSFDSSETHLLWEGDDYFFEVIGSLSEEQAIKLAESVVEYDGEIPDRELVPIVRE